MKRVCFVELEGVLCEYGDYSPNDRKVRVFLDELSEFCKKNKIDLFLISGHHHSVAEDKMMANEFGKYFDKDHFFFVDDGYINAKQEVDKKLHLHGLAKNPTFVDSYFKQTVMKDILEKKNLSPKQALLLCEDVWLDGYYTQRFTKVDFALLQTNLLDRGKPTDLISGLAYFALEFDSVKQLLENFPKVDLSALDKYVFESMKKALVGDNFADMVKKGLEKKGKEKMGGS